MSTFELAAAAKKPGAPEPPESYGLQRAILVDNARWFVNVRWAVTLVLIAVGLASRLLPGTLARLGIAPPDTWPWLLATLLAVANVGFGFLTRRLGYGSPARAVACAIWLQIVFDLIILTTLVHLVGSTVTFVAFTYLFHIVLACIFLPRAQSLIVLALAAALYGGCVITELTGVVPPASILARPALTETGVFLALAAASSAMALWLVVWYLVSSLAATVQKRDHQLAQANEQLMRADEAKNQQMLRTAHDLKAPFSGIESNIQLLRTQHWNEIPAAVQDLVERIQVRALTLSARIKDILLLGDLRSQATQRAQLAPVDLPQVLREVVEDLQETARERQVTVHVEVPLLAVAGDPRQVAVLFGNLVANAILYSHPGGRVVLAAAAEPGQVTARVTDQGIGISAGTLPHIFDEYFRTKEGARFNRLSTGLGLTIVRQVAENLGYRIRVTSEPDQGSTFEVIMPGAEARSHQ